MEKLTFPEFVDNMLTNTLNAAEIKCFAVTNFFISQSFLYYVDL